jgi:serine/threonine-protein kinase HipA
MPYLKVALNGIVVGELGKLKNGGITFQYEKNWLDRKGARPISLSMPLQHKIYQGSVVYNFFDNLLPDNDVVKAHIQAKFHTPTTQPFDLLAQIGMDCVGALQLYPADVALPAVQHITAKPLTTPEITTILKGYQTGNPMGMNGIDDFRISLAGAQEKTGLLWYQNQWHKPFGSTPTSHIFKLPIGKLPHVNIDLSESCENEWLCLRIADAYGLPVPHAHIGKFEDMKALIVERFDRRWSSDQSWLMRLPQEDMCQALGVAAGRKYEADGGPGIAQIMTFLLGSHQPSEDRERFFKAQVLFWMLAAIDGHAKNFSIFLAPAGRYQMAPLYDIISAYPLIKSKPSAPKVKMAMALYGQNKHYAWQEIQPRHFISTAKKVGFSVGRAEEIMAEMKKNTDTVIESVLEQLPTDFPTHISEPILAGLRKQADKL